MLRRRVPAGGTDADVSCPANVRLDQYPGLIRLGRHTNCEVRCLSQKASGERDVVNAAVSRWHAEIARREGGGYVVRDKSANGTFVNGQRINGDHTLAAGDVIILGMPTYKSNLEPATEVVNPFIFEFVAEQGASAQQAKEAAPEPITAPSDPRLLKKNSMGRVVAIKSPIPELAPPRTELPRPAVPIRQTGPGSLGREDNNTETQPEDGRGARIEGAVREIRRVPKPPSSAPSADGLARRTGPREVPMIYACSPGVSIWINGGEVSPSELPLALDVGQQEEPGASNGGPGGARSVVVEEPSSEERGAHGERHVRQRMQELVRAKERADERQGDPSRKRRNTTPASEEVMMGRAKRSRPGATESGGSGLSQASGTPLTLADDCALLDIPGVGGEGRSQGLRPGLGPTYDRVFVDLGDSPDKPVGNGLVRNTETPAVGPPRTEPKTAADAVGEAAPGATSVSSVAEKDLSAARSGESELLDMLGEEMQCVICQNFLCAAHALPCSHTFCGDCLSQWLTKKPHCPTCRRPIGSATPTPIHNIDSMIERAANKCMSLEEKLEFDKRRGAIKESKKLEPRPPSAAAAHSSARAGRVRVMRPAPTVDELRSGTLQAVSARLDEAMTSLSAERARELVTRVQERRRMMAVRRGPPPPPPPTFGRDQFVPRESPLYQVDQTATGDSVCAICKHTIAAGDFRLTERVPEAARRFHFGCRNNHASVQLDDIVGMDAFNPGTQNMLKIMLSRGRAR